MDKLFKAGEQILYVPDHVDGDLEHRDVQIGFVMFDQDPGADAVFCRYFYKRNGEAGVLRTVACSELTPTRLLVRTEPHMKQWQNPTHIEVTHKALTEGLLS